MAMSAHPLHPLLQVNGVDLRYRTHRAQIQATHDVSFDVFPAERFVLLGPSGCGKSSLLKAIGGFLSPAGGRIQLENQPVTRPGPDRMMVFQEFDQLPPWKTVLENTLFPLVASGRLP
ncbi:ATP-binding cassette domain-containing protein, partial [Dickeya dianthicola]